MATLHGIGCESPGTGRRRRDRDHDDHGRVWARGHHFAMAVVYPVVVLGMIAPVSKVTGAVDLSQANWGKAGLNFLLVTVSTILVATITEEGFFKVGSGLRSRGPARNGGAYVLFGFGTKVGALGIKQTAIYGPEVGVLGLALNVIFAVALWRFWSPRAGGGQSVRSASA